MLRDSIFGSDMNFKLFVCSFIDIKNSLHLTWFIIKVLSILIQFITALYNKK